MKSVQAAALLVFATACTPPTSLTDYAPGIQAVRFRMAGRWIVPSEADLAEIRRGLQGASRVRVEPWTGAYSERLDPTTERGTAATLLVQRVGTACELGAVYRSEAVDRVLERLRKAFPAD